MIPIASEFHLENDSSLQRDNWWGWSVWVEGPDEQLDAIESVTYQLHPTFPNPIRRISDRDSKFKLKGAGWGEFPIRATVATRDGHSFALERWLTLGDGTIPGDDSSDGHSATLYFAYGVVDAPLVHKLSEALSEQGCDVLRADRDMSPGQRIEEALDMQMRRADAVIPVFSNPYNEWVIAEAEHALKLDRFVLPIVYNQSDVPAQFAHLLRLKVDDQPNIAELANTIASRVKDHAIED